MRLELDDPRLMDYVLGELKNGDALDVAAALELDENKEARELVEELRGVADTARRILHEEDGDVALSDEQRAAIVGTVGEENVVPIRKRVDWILKGVAAILVLGTIPAIFGYNTLGSHSPESVALRVQPVQGAESRAEAERHERQLAKLSEPEDLAISPESQQQLSDEERAKMRRNMDSLLSVAAAGDAVYLSPESAMPAPGAPRAEPESPAIENFDLENLGESSSTQNLTPEEQKELRVQEHVKYAKLYADEGLNAQAVEIYSHALQLDPTNKVAKEGLHQASQAIAAEDPKDKLRQIESDSSKIRQYVEASKQLPEGADAKGIKNYAFRVPEVQGAESTTSPNDGSEAFSNRLSDHGVARNGGGQSSAKPAEDDWENINVGNLSGQAGVDLSPSGTSAGSAAPAEAPMVEARNRLELKANLKDGLSLKYENRAERPDLSAAKPAEEQWAEYNVGNLTGQTALPEQVASNFGIEPVSPPAQPENKLLWQWNTPSDKPTEIVGGPGTETYVKVAGVKPFVAVKDEPLSTFSIDVDTAGYSNVRRFLSQGQLPPADAVRIEEMINYFAYSYPQPTDGRPFAVSAMGAPAPWAPEHQLVRIGVKGKEVPASERPQANLVFLLDVSGSMGDANKLPLVKESMKTLLSQLRPNDRVGIVTYAGNARLVLGSTPCGESATITAAIESLQSGGSTNGGGGIQMAYDLAQSNFIKEGINRVIMATDGDFNVGTTEHGDLMGMIAARAKSGVFLTTLGFGMGNLKDATLEQLADRGNGNYAYIDNHAEARKALVEQLSGTLQTIAKDVKIQVEFNPAKVSHYRLLGYENRALAAQDFNDDTKDAGEIGAGHTVTALYEIIPVGASPMTGVDALKYQSTTPGVDALKYQGGAATQAPASPEPVKGEERIAPEPMPLPAGEWLTVKMRYKQPEGSESTKLEVPLLAMNGDLRETDPDFRFASAVAAFGQVLRNSGYQHPSNFDRIIELARSAANGDADRDAFVDLVITAKTLSTQNR